MWRPGHIYCPLAFPRPAPPPPPTTAAALRLIIAVQLRPPLCLPVRLSVLVMGAVTTPARVGWAVLSAPCHAVLPTRRQFNVRGRIGGCFLVAPRCSFLGRSGATLSFFVVLFGLRAQKVRNCCVQVGRRLFVFWWHERRELLSLMVSRTAVYHIPPAL